MSAEQLTLDGRSVPHDDVVRGPSASRMVRRPSPGDYSWDSVESDFMVKLAQALDHAKVAPGEAFYVSRVPPVDRPAPGGARRSDPSTSKRAALDVAPRTGSQRDALLAHFEIVADAHHARLRGTGPRGLTAEEAATSIGKPGAWRRVSELLDGGFIERTGHERPTLSGSAAEVYRITEKGREALAAGRSIR